MMKFTKLAASATVAVSLLAVSAAAAPYKITTIDSNGTFAGCIAQNDDAGLGIVAVGSSVAVLAQSKSFAFGEGDQVSGSWSVDGGKPVEFSGKAGHAGVATLEVPNNAEAVTALTTGKMLDVTANGTKAQYELADMGQAFGSLVQCMENKKAP